MRLLSEQALNDFFEENFTPERYSQAFRVEFLSEYAVGTDGNDFQRWLAGEPEPTWERKNRFLDTIREETAAGLVTRRVKVVADPRTDYDRYACEWGYALNAPAGEQIRIWDLADGDLPGREQGLVTEDFWLLGDDRVLHMHYDEHGRFEGASIPESASLIDYLRTREVLWDGAEPFETWYPAHPELLRARRAA